MWESSYPPCPPRLTVQDEQSDRLCQGLGAIRGENARAHLDTPARLAMGTAGGPAKWQCIHSSNNKQSTLGHTRTLGSNGGGARSSLQDPSVQRDITSRAAVCAASLSSLPCRPKSRCGLERAGREICAASIEEIERTSVKHAPINKRKKKGKKGKKKKKNSSYAGEISTLPQNLPCALKPAVIVQYYSVLCNRVLLRNPYS